MQDWPSNLRKTGEHAFDLKVLPGFEDKYRPGFAKVAAFHIDSWKLVGIEVHTGMSFAADC